MKKKASSAIFSLYPAARKLAEAILLSSGYRWTRRSIHQHSIGLWRQTNRRSEKKEKLLFIPGLGDSAVSWSSVFLLLHPWLRRRYREIVLIDFPGFNGWLSTEKPFSSMDELYQAIHQLLDEEEPTSIFAHSLGSWLSILYLLSERRKSTPHTLALMCPPGLFSGEDHRAQWNSIFSGMIERGTEAWRPAIFKKEPLWFPWIVDGASAFLDHPDIRQFMLSVNTHHYQFEERLESLDCRISALWGEYDPFVPPSTRKIWAQSLKNPRCQFSTSVLNGVAHSPHVENAIGTARFLLGALHNK